MQDALKTSECRCNKAAITSLVNTPPGILLCRKFWQDCYKKKSVSREKIREQKFCVDSDRKLLNCLRPVATNLKHNDKLKKFILSLTSKLFYEHMNTPQWTVVIFVLLWVQCEVFN